MRVFTLICRAMAWVLLTLTTAIQVMAIYSIYVKNSTHVFNPLLLIIATVVMLLAVIFFFASPRKKGLLLLIAAADAVFFIILAFWLKDAFPTYLSADGSEYGVSSWIAVWRHMSPALIPLFLLPSWHQHHTAYQAIKNAESAAKTPSYFDTLGPSYKADLSEESLPKPKRSVRHRLRKDTEETP